MGRRILSVLAVLALCLSWLPGTAWAAEGDGGDDGGTTVDSVGMLCGKPLVYGHYYPVSYLEDEEIGVVGEGVERKPDTGAYLHFTQGSGYDDLEVCGKVILKGPDSGPAIDILGISNESRLYIHGEGSALTLIPGSAQAAIPNEILVLGGSVSVTICGTNNTLNKLENSGEYSGDIRIQAGISDSVSLHSTGNVTIIANTSSAAFQGAVIIDTSGAVELENSSGPLFSEGEDNRLALSIQGSTVSLTSNSEAPTVPSRTTPPAIAANEGDVNIRNNANNGNGSVVSDGSPAVISVPPGCSVIRNGVPDVPTPDEEGIITLDKGLYGELRAQKADLTIQLENINTTTIKSIEGHATNCEQVTSLTFAGPGEFTITEQFNISGVSNEICLTDRAKVKVNADNIGFGYTFTGSKLKIDGDSVLTIGDSTKYNADQTVERVEFDGKGILNIYGTLNLRAFTDSDDSTLTDRINLGQDGTININSGTNPALMIDILGEVSNLSEEQIEQINDELAKILDMSDYYIGKFEMGNNGVASEALVLLQKSDDQPVTGQLSLRTQSTSGGTVTPTPDPDPTPPRPTVIYYSITAKAGEGGTVTGGRSYAAWSTATLTAAPADGYTFSHWEENGAALDAGNPYTFTVTRSRTITACFEEIPPAVYTITLEADGGGTVSGGGTFQEGETVAVTAVPDGNWLFTAWTEGDETVSSAPVYTFDVTRDMTLTAHFEEVPSYTVTVEAEEGGTASGGGTFREGETAALTAEPGEGWYFVHWDDGTTTLTDNPYTFVVVEDRTLTACFEKKATPELAVTPSDESLTGGGEVTLTVTGVPDGGEVSLSCSSGDVELIPGTEANTWTVELPDEAAEYVFTAVYPGDGTHNAVEASCTVQVSERPDEPEPGRPIYPSYPSYPSTPSKPSKPSTPSTPGTPAAPVEPDPVPEEPKDCDGGPGCPSRPYPDLDTSAWYHPDTDFVLEQGLMQGFEDGTFRPDERISRAMLVQTLYNYAGRPAVTADVQFSDVPADAWYAPAVRWAVSRGIVQGFEDGTFRPDAPIVREELAVMLWRCAGSPAAEDAALPFADAERASDWALAALRWAVKHGVLEGKGGGVLDPQGFATRAEAAKMLRKFMEEQ